MFRNLDNCRNIKDFQLLAKKRLPRAIFHYIDGAAEDETTYRRNTLAFEEVDLVPNVLQDVSNIDISTTVMGQKLGMPLFCSPTALQRLFHFQGEEAVAKAASNFNTMFGVSSLTTTTLDKIKSLPDCPKIFQFYYHKDKGLNRAMIESAKEANFDVLALTVDTITGGNRERDLKTGFTSPPRLTPKTLLSFLTHPNWTINYLTHEKFRLPLMENFVKEGSKISITVGEYFSTMLDQSLNWDKALELRELWGGHFCLKGIMSPRDAKNAVSIGASGIMVSNHGGRQLDGARSPFDQISEIANAVGDDLDVILDGGIRRGSHVLKALASGAKACSGGRMYLYALAAGGQKGVQKALGIMREEIIRDMKLMGVSSINEINGSMLRRRIN
ncbi:MAG: alpha-hydroxy-acid oxidizing enzyme [Methylococcaceae bacterium TMED69]|nr:MAG: alpha-hydroxy-acid oxidizing enzyme [Methylococcaceae bacterium TMED69]|tara:strand:+ start:224 stop:1384 length:1161 start_codon:yes stop_codon:yes gene_type:complete